MRLNVAAGYEGKTSGVMAMFINLFVLVVIGMIGVGMYVAYQSSERVDEDLQDEELDYQEYLTALQMAKLERGR